jgi:hypothetical protein
MKTLVPILIVLSNLFNAVFSQEIPDTLVNSRNDLLNVYLDCKYCDFDYFRTNFTEINYMHNRQDADVHIMVNELTNGSGGSQYDIIFKGLKRYAGHRDTLVFNVPGRATDEEIRYAMLENVQLGLVPYLVKTPSKDRMSLFFDETFAPTDETDPWRNWMFELSAGGRYSNTKSLQDLSLNGSLYLSKINPEIKFESSTYFDYNDSKMNLYEGDSLVFNYNMIQRSFSSYNHLVKSLGEHAGIGGVARFTKNDYSNIKFQTVAGPAVEINLFKYSEASRRSLIFRYSILYEHSHYNNLTINNRMKDDLFRHELRMGFTYYENWGTLNSSIWASGYLNDYNQFSVGTFNMASINLGKGVSFYVSFGISYVRNQIYLQKGDASMEELLLGQREMYSDFNYNVGIGLSYRFGSIFNNAVNPRFGYW